MISRIFITITIAISCFIVSTDAFAARNEDLFRAQQAADQGDWEAALEHARKAVENKPKDEDTWAMLADAELFLGDTVSAVQHYETALEHNPKLASAVLDLTSLYVTKDRLENADRVVAAAEKKDSRGRIDEIKVARALILGKQGKIAEATAILASATGKHPDNPLYPRMLARIYRNAGVPDLAAINYEKAWTLDQGNADLAFEYGQTLLKLKRYDEANRLFAIVQERDPDNKSVDYLRGRLLHAAGRFAEASSELEKAVEKKPEDFLSNYWLGIAYLDFARSTGKNVYGLAIAPLDKALELRPEREDVSKQLGLAVFEQGRFNYRLANQDTTDEFKSEKLHTALDLFHESLQYDQADEVYSYMARAFDKLENLDSALVYTQKQLDFMLLKHVKTSMEEAAIANGDTSMSTQDLDIAQYTDSTSLRIKIALENMNDVRRYVSILQRLKDQKGLVKFLSGLSENETIFGQYGMILANAYIETNKDNKARETVNRLIEKNPEDCSLHQLNAYIDLKRDRYKSAIQVLLKGVKACPKDPELWVFLGDSYYFSDEKHRPTVEKSLEAYRKSCDLGSAVGCEKAEQIVQILEQWR